MNAKRTDPNRALMVDEMAIRKGVVYSDREQMFVGYVDQGAGDVQDGRLATKSLMFMAVGLKGQWRYSVAYLLLG